MSSFQPICFNCNRTPEQCGYWQFCEDGETPDEYVRSNEGTYNPNNGHFACDACYIKIGMPSSPRGWIAP